jgi:hypothetical protein
MSIAAVIMKIVCDKDMLSGDVNHDADAEAQPELNDVTNGI